MYYNKYLVTGKFDSWVPLRTTRQYINGLCNGQKVQCTEIHQQSFFKLENP